MLSESCILLTSVKYQVAVGLGDDVVVVVVVVSSELVVNELVLVATQLAHERLAAQCSWEDEQMDVVTVDRHELPLEVTIGWVVIDAVVFDVAVVDETVEEGGEVVLVTMVDNAAS